MKSEKKANAIDPKKRYSLPVVADLLGYKDRSGIRYFVKSGKIPKKYIQVTNTMLTKRQMILGERVLSALATKKQ